jgi:ATP-dependent Clp protease adapter protein ClpS
VAALLKSIPSLTAEGAVNIMLEAHNTGQAVVITCLLG